MDFARRNSRSLGHLSHTKLGLVVHAVGENPKAAHAIGYSVISVRVLAIAFGGAMAGFTSACRRWSIRHSGPME